MTAGPDRGPGPVAAALRPALRLGLPSRFAAAAVAAGVPGLVDQIGGQLVVEPERDRHRRMAGAIDQEFPAARASNGSKPEWAGRANSPATSCPLIGTRIGVVGFDEAKNFPALNHAQAIEAVSRGRLVIFRAEKIVGTVRGDEDRLGAARQLALVLLQCDHAEQIAADGGAA